MVTKNESIDPYVKSLIECKARQLVGKCGIRSGDIKDIEQDLYLDFLQRKSKYDPQKSKFTTFCQRIVERKISKIIRERAAMKRVLNDTAASLQEVVGVDEFGEEISLGDTIVDESAAPPDFLVDVKLILESMPQTHRDAYELLMDGVCVSDVARTIGIPRETFRDVILRDLRVAFEIFKKN